MGLGCSVQEARGFIANFWNTYPEHYRWMQQTQRQVLQEGYLRTPTGRVMRFPVVFDHRALRQGVNFPIQANASDYNLISMIELEHPERNAALRRLNSRVILNVHDCLIFESDRRYRDEVVALVRAIMEAPKFPGYPSVKVDIKIGDSLGSVRKV